ncbi:unnamed protein product, partial [Rotaria sordida]
MYLSSQIFRYVVTQDLAIKASAWTHFQSLELLNQVSGVPGYPGRSFAKRSDFPPAPQWYPSPVYPTLQFQGDTSSDEIVGHEFVYPLVHDSLASSDDERQRAYILLFNITTNIMTHDCGQINQTQHLFTNINTSSPAFDCNALSADAVWYMQRWPLELIAWPQFNSDRLDIQLNIPAECEQKPLSLQMLPPDERTTKKWNTNIYSLDDGDGFYEEDPTAFLISYW